MYFCIQSVGKILRGQLNFQQLDASFISSNEEETLLIFESKFKLVTVVVRGAW